MCSLFSSVCPLSLEFKSEKRIAKQKGNMGRLFKRHLDHPPSIYCCKGCGTHLCDTKNVISTSFHGRCGRAVLISGVINVYFMRAEERQLMTGLHIVRDVHCVQCHENVGWTYDYAHDERERYKIENFVLEKELLVTKKQYPIDEVYQVEGPGAPTARSVGGNLASPSSPGDQRPGQAVPRRVPSTVAASPAPRLSTLGVLQRVRAAVAGGRPTAPQVPQRPPSQS